MKYYKYIFIDIIYNNSDMFTQQILKLTKQFTLDNKWIP